MYDWKIAFGNAVGRGGSCSYTTKTLRFSRVYIRATTDAGVRNTITHEVAHAICGPGHKHDEYWQRTHRRLGGDGRASVAESQIIDKRSIDRLKPNLVVCIKCKTLLGRSTRKLKTKGRIHRNCGGGIYNVHISEVSNPGDSLTRA